MGSAPWLRRAEPGVTEPPVLERESVPPLGRTGGGSFGCGCGVGASLVPLLDSSELSEWVTIDDVVADEGVRR